MPVSRSTEEERAQSNGRETPPHLRAYEFHGVELHIAGTHGVGECPFCGKDKFSVEVSTGLWRCWVCGTGTDRGGGNPLVFIRRLYELYAAETPSEFHQLVAMDRGYLDWSTPRSWGVARGKDGEWVLPGYGPDGDLDQLYRRVWMKDEWRLLPTPGIWPEGRVHALHLPRQDFTLGTLPTIIVCEGPWDGMALWEAARYGSDDNSSIISVPGCNVWRDEWTEMCRGKNVVLLYDSDHPREQMEKIYRAGWDGMQRVAKRLSGIAASLRMVHWGPSGYDPDRPTGWDVRDFLSHPTPEGRSAAVLELFLKVGSAPSDWFSQTYAAGADNLTVVKDLEAIPCNNWHQCEAAWDMSRGGALMWRQDLRDALAVILAVCASTNQSGNQLFLDLIGNPGSAKTTLCKGLLASKHCIRLENATKLISGYKMQTETGEDKDCSFISRANGKTWVTCEMDTLVSSPQYNELMGKVRRIFDGDTSSTYGNSDEDRLYIALRTPWVRAGTPRMMDHDQSHLGDRFLKFIISDPSDKDKRAMARAALRSERSAMLDSADGTAGSIVEPKTRQAQALTGGYVDWLRAHVEHELTKVSVSEDAEDFCIDLAELSADLRARPCEDKKKVESHDTKELPTRLARQNIRLATCLAVVLNEREVTEDILRIVRKVALDTASGHSLNIVRYICSACERSSEGLNWQECGGLWNTTLEMWISMPKERLSRYMTFLQRIDVVEWNQPEGHSGGWILTDRVYDLYLKIMAR